MRWHRVRKPDRDAVNQVDGIGYVHHDEYGERHTHPWRQLIDSEESVERLDPYARSHRLTAQYLHYELLLIPHSDEIIGEAHQEEHHATHQQGEVLVGSLPCMAPLFRPIR